MIFRFPKKDEYYSEFTCARSYVFVLSAMTMRGWSILPSRFAARYAVFNLLLFGALIWWHWEAMLVSYLATRKISLPFNNIPELVSNTQFNIELVPGTSFEDAFRYSLDPVWQNAFKNRIEPFLEKNEGLGTPDFVEILKKDPQSAYYDNYFTVM